MLQESYALSPSVVDNSTLDQGNNPLLRRGHLESATDAQAVIQHTGISLVFVTNGNNLTDWDDVWKGVTLRPVE